MQPWNNGSIGGTPINASRLNHVEDGIFDSASVADSVFSVANNEFSIAI